MLRNSIDQTIVDDLCRKLRCSELAGDMERVNHAREKLTQLQQIEILKNLDTSTEKFWADKKSFSSFQKSHSFLKTQQQLEPRVSSINENQSEFYMDKFEESELPEEEHEMEKSLQGDDVAQDAWWGFFRRYEILNEIQACKTGVHKQCIELSFRDDNNSIEEYLRMGVRCFMIDLFIGTELEKQKLILKLRESELKVSKEYGFPITTCLFAMLSPRLPYTGIMYDKNSTEELKIGDYVIVTTKTEYSSICTTSQIYVNARFLVESCRINDLIQVGSSIQLKVTEAVEDELKCLVVEPGVLFSRMPVRFPAGCNHSHISLEELENMTFAREVGINVLVSYKPEPKQYLRDLNDALRLLECDNLKLFTRVVLAECKEDDLQWISEAYDGFLVDFGNHPYSEENPTESQNFSNDQTIVNLSPAYVQFLTSIYNMKKPIILNPNLTNECLLTVQPDNERHVFFYPDKFIFSRENYKNACTFFILQNSVIEKISSTALSEQATFNPCDLDDDAIAQACVAASLDCQAKAIIVCSAWPYMAINLSHYRPKAPIIQVSAMKSIGDFISLYHHTSFLHFPTFSQYNYTEYVTNALIFCMIFLKSGDILRDGEKVLLVYGTQSDTQIMDLTWDERHGLKPLMQILWVIS